MIHFLLSVYKSMSVLEWLGALTGLAGVYLTVKGKIENWLFALISSLIYFFIFKDYKLYANAGLQLFVFVPCCIYGWWVWLKWGPTHNDDLPVRRIKPLTLLIYFIFASIFSLAFGYYLSHHTNDQYAYTDAATTGFSIAAQLIQALKLFENWHLWIIIDAVCAFYLFPAQKLWVTSFLYALFTYLAFRGAVEWKPLIGRRILHGEVVDKA